MKFLLVDPATPDLSTWILPAVLLILFIGIFVMNYFRSKKSQETMRNMVESLKVGDNVKTYSGLYGKILEITETTDGKIVVLETGNAKHKGIFSIDINAIYSIDAKQPIVYDKDGNIVLSKLEGAEVETKIEEKEIKQVEEKPKIAKQKSTSAKKKSTSTKKKSAKSKK